MDLVEKVVRISLGVWLTAVSVEDIRHKKVRLWYVLAVLLPGIVVAIRYSRSEAVSILGGAGIGVFLCILSKLTGQKIGTGDGLTVMVIGVYMRIRFTIVCLCMAFFLVSFAALGMYVMRKKQMKDRVAFIPFLSTAYCVLLCVSGG